MATDPIEALRDIALSLPEATEKETWGHPTFRVRNKIFVSFGDADGGPVVTMKAAEGEQESLLAEGDPFFFPKYVGPKGWVGVKVSDETDWTAIGELVVDSYLQIAPTTLSKGIAIAANPQTKTRQVVLNVGGVIGELVEGKPPKDQSIAVAEADDDEPDGLKKLDFDPDDPGSTTIEI